MSKLNLLFSLASLSVILVTLERFSITTKILLSPDNFLRLHELVQISFLILFTVIIPTLYLREITHNFALVKEKRGGILLLLFIVGIYFYATGNGVHELASFQFNHFCDTKNISGTLCKGMFFNDYYFGNILYFIGASLMILPLLIFEKKSVVKIVEKKDKVILIANSIFYSLAIIAYAAFDRVLVGLVFTVLMMGMSWVFFLPNRKKLWNFPFTLYTFISYTLGGVISLFIRFIR